MYAHLYYVHACKHDAELNRAMTTHAWNSIPAEIVAEQDPERRLVLAELYEQKNLNVSAVLHWHYSPQCGGSVICINILLQLHYMLHIAGGW